MRRVSVCVLAAAALLAGMATLAGPSRALAEECTGENCPPPQGSTGGSDCERKKNEQTVS